MKKYGRPVKVVLFLGLFLLLSALGVSQTKEIEGNSERIHKFGIGFGAGYAAPADTNYGNSVKFGGSIYIQVHRNVVFELAATTFKSNIEEKPEGLDDGKLTVFPLQLSIQGRFPQSRHFIPFVFAGVSYYMNDYILDSQITEEWQLIGFDIDEEVDNTFGFHIGAGFDIFLMKKLAITADITYCIGEAKGAWTLTDQISEASILGEIKDIKLNSFLFEVGLKFFI